MGDNGKVRLLSRMCNIVDTRCLFDKRGSQHGKIRKQQVRSEEDDDGSHERTA